MVRVAAAARPDPAPMKEKDQLVREQDTVESSAGIVPTVSITLCSTVHLPQYIHHRMPSGLESSEDLGRQSPPLHSGQDCWQPQMESGAIKGGIGDKVEVPHDDQTPSRAWL
jgi:hypothetical protein